MACVRPKDPEDLQALVRWARSTRTPLVPRGAGSSLDGESVPPDGGVVIDLSRWDGILEVDPVERLVRVQPGVVNLDLHRALRRHGLFFPPNPGSWTVCTLGGNVATNASGPRSYRYGATRAWVRGLELVLGTGERITCGRWVRKRSLGPELCGLFVGSEGTLGVFTELTLALAEAPERRVGLAVRLEEAGAIERVAHGLRSSAHSPLSSMEFLDERSTDELARLSSGRIQGGAATMLLEVESTDSEETVRLERMLAQLRELGVGTDPTVFPDADAMWTLRGRSSEALDRSVGPRVREDVAVPVARLGELFALVERLAREYQAPSYVFGHLGEGNLHPNFAIAPGSPRGEALRRELLVGALALGGTISAEHGVGAMKRGLVPAELGAVEAGLLWAWKAACDPDGILNPGKLYPNRSADGSPPSPSPSGAATGPTPPT
ncbi:MAG: FAD-binding oxidoreductase [Thermoplasmata archaeon]|nr:FAD-binding oxidoreductase [Thermoplasmata archaeon]